MLDNRRVPKVIFLSLALIYLAQSVFAHPDPDTMQRYHLSRGQLVLLVLTIALPYMVIWFIALFGYLRLSVYASAIRQSREGKALGLIAQGLLILVLWLPINAVLGNIITYMSRAHPDSIAGIV